MLGAQVTIAFRHAVGDRLYSLINLAGLAIGLACFVLIGVFVRYELGYDRHYAHSDRIYRISRDFYSAAGSTEAHLAANAGPVAPLLKEDFPEIEKAARVFCCGAVLKTPDGPALMHPGYAMADPELFEIFDFEWLRGDPATALAGPYDVVLTRSSAQRHFGDADPLGQTLLVVGGSGSSESLRVTGVIEDLRDDTTLDFDLLQSMAAWNTEPGAQRYVNDWRNNVFHTYVLLAQGADIRDVQRRSAEFFERRFEPGSSAYTGFTATPIAAIHLSSDRQGEMRGSRESKIGDAGTVYTFSAIALFVLLLACINFTNLATARSAQRAKEIGVRKSVGAGRGRLIAQFLLESVLLAVLALVVAVALVELALPAFGAFLGKPLELAYARDPLVPGVLVAIAVVTGLVAGAYPAFYLSAFDPVRVLKGEVTRGKAGGLLRRTLVVAQFSVSIALLIATAVIYEQLEFARGVDLGFDKEQIVVVRPNSAKGERWETLKREWLGNPEILGATQSDVLPFESNGRTAEIRTGDAAERMQFMAVDYDFFETYGIELVVGRTFSSAFGDRPENEDDPSALTNASFIVNELAARRLGLTPEQAIGRRVSFGSVQGTRFRVDDASGTIVGVVKNVYYESLHAPIAPTVYRIPGGSYVVSLRITGRDVPATLAHVDERWQAFNPDLPVSRRFLDQTFTALYDAEERQQRMLAAFAALAMSIACLGVLGLVSFATERRAKEIGVRKVMGGTIADIVALFAGEFGKLVLLANLVAWPVAFVFARRWLDAFAYRIELGPSPFVASALLALVVALMTVAAVTARAAAAKPIQSLRHE
jgi:putative ABC transport system permease protein